jgi:hypothetical protein
VRRLVERERGIESVMTEEPPLEDVYLKLLHPEGSHSEPHDRLACQGAD